MEHNTATTQGWLTPYRVLPDQWTHLAAITASGKYSEHQRLSKIAETEKAV
jgi:hypothetical protein